MQKEEYHPKAYLMYRRNVIRGLKARTKILKVMSEDKDRIEGEDESGREKTAKEISEVSHLSYLSSLHHLRLLEIENIVKRKGKRPCKWRITGIGQKSLADINFLTEGG